MAWIPISLTVPQYVDANGDPYSGAVLKFYANGTTTNISLATDSTGATTAASVALNASGFPEISGNVVIPHVEEDFKIALYPTQAAADADSGALWTIDDVSIGQDVAQWVDSGSTPTQASTTTFTVAGDRTSLFHVGRRLKLVDSGGTDYATVTAVAYSSPDTTVTVVVDGGGSLDAGLSTVQVSILTADGTSALPGVEISEDDWTFQGDVDVEGVHTAASAVVTGTMTAGKAALPRSWLAGLGLSNDTDAEHDIAIAVGAARDDADAADLRLAAILTKQIDAAWAVGDDAGGLDTGSVTTATWYHVFLIRRSDTGVVDALFSTSSTAPTMPTNYDQKRRIGAVLTDGSSNILSFAQIGDEWVWKDRTAVGLDLDATVTTAQTPTLKAPPGTLAHVAVSATAGSGTSAVYLTPTSVDDEAPSVSASPLASVGHVTAVDTGGVTQTLTAAQVSVRVDASSQARVRAVGSGATTRIQVLGWTDRRGRDD